MLRNLSFSLVPLRLYPSTTFTTIDTAERLNCEVRPKTSSRGKALVFEYTLNTN